MGVLFNLILDIMKDVIKGIIDKYGIKDVWYFLIISGREVSVKIDFIDGFKIV